MISPRRAKTRSRINSTKSDVSMIQKRAVLSGAFFCRLIVYGYSMLIPPFCGLSCMLHAPLPIVLAASCLTSTSSSPARSL